MQDAWAGQSVRRRTLGIAALLAAALCLAAVAVRGRLRAAEQQPEWIIQQQQQQQQDEKQQLPCQESGPPLPCMFTSLLRQSEVQWSTRNGSAHRLSVEGCRMHRFSAQQAKQCLAGKRLVFVGDSITRYQYLLLVYFLERGRWPAPMGGVRGDPSPANKHEWGSWNDFLLGTNAALGGRELCDCFRGQNSSAKSDMQVEQEKFENRFYSSQADNTSVSYISFTSEPHQVHGHYGFPPWLKGRRPCAPATCNSTADYQFDLAQALRKPVRELRPTHLVVNTGLWGSSNKLEDDVMAGIAYAGKLAVAEQRGRVFWKTTTAQGPARTPLNRDHDSLALKAVGQSGWGVFDAYAITRPLAAMPQPPYWDHSHFIAVVYRELNQYLLNMICHPYG